MNISPEMNDALQSLQSANILNTGRVISDFLRTSATETDICAYIEKNAEKVVLEAELRAFSATKNFPEDPHVCIPFIYTLLYIFDTEKITAEDFVSSVYRKSDLDDAIEVFFTDMARSLAASLLLIKAEDLLSDPKNDIPVSDIENSVSTFIETVKQSDAENQAEILSTASLLLSAIKEKDFQKAREIFLSLQQLVSDVVPLSDALLTVKSDLARSGVVL